MRLAAFSVLLCLCVVAGAAQAEQRIGLVSKKPLPRYESIGAAEAYGRRGPGLDHRIDWVYERRGLPVLVIQESDVWRRVRDPDGAETWIHVSKLSPTATVYIADAPADGRPLLERPKPSARPVALVMKGAVGRLSDCSSGWRKLTIDGHRGWVPVHALWGAAECRR